MFSEFFTTLFDPRFLPVIPLFLILILVFYFKQPVLRVLKFWGLVLVLNLAMMLIIYTSRPETQASALITNTTGYSALILIMLALIAGPSVRVIKNKKIAQIFKLLLKNRRNIGVAGFLLALVHYLSNWSFLFNWDYNLLQLLLNADKDFAKGVYFGLSGFFLFFLAAIVSNKKSQKKLGAKLWKWIQLLCYPALLLIIFHILIIGRVLQDSLFLLILMWLFFIFTFLIKLIDVFLKFSKKSSVK